MGQMAATLANRLQESLPSNTEENPKEHTNAITLRSGRQKEQLQSQDTNAESQDKVKEDKKEDTGKSDDSAV